MKTHRQNGKVIINFLPDNGFGIKITRAYSKKGDELFNTFQYGRYLITINQSKAVKLCQIPNLQHENVIILSPEETRPLLKYLNISDKGFYGKIIYRHDKAENFAPIIIIDFDRIIKSIKRRGVRSIKKRILSTFSHEIRHAEQYQKNLFPLKGFWLFVKYCRNIKRRLSRRRLSRKNKFLIYFAIGGVLLVLSGVLSSHPLFWIIMASSLMIYLLFDLLMLKIYDWDPSEKDAKSFSQKVIQDKRWRECVKVIKIVKNKKALKKEPQ